MSGSRIVRLSLVAALTAVSLSAAAGGLVRVGRSPAPAPMQHADVAGRMTQVTLDGVKTTHTLRTQAEAIEGVIARGNLKDPLVLHREALTKIGTTANQAEAELIRLKGTNYEFVLPVNGKPVTEAIKDIAPELEAWLRTKSLAPASAEAAAQRWLLQVGGKTVPLRPPLIRRPGREGAI